MRLEPDVRDGLDLVVRFLRIQVAALRAAGVPVGEDDYRGLYISERDVDRLLGEGGPPADRTAFAEIGEELAQLRKELDALHARATGRLGRVVSLGPFDAPELGAILLSLAASCDQNIERLVAYAQDDVSRRRPRVGLMLGLFANDAFAGRDSWQAGAPMRALGVIELHDEGAAGQPLTSKTVVLDPRISEYLLGGDALGEPLAAIASLVAESPGPDVFAAEVVSQLRAIATMPAPRPRTIALRCIDPGLSSAAARVVADESGMELLQVELAGLPTETSLDTAVTHAVREAWLRNSALLFEVADGLSPADVGRLGRLLDGHARGPLPAFVALDDVTTWPGLHIDLPPLDFERRKALWEQSVANPAAGKVGSDDAMERVAARFSLNVRAIRQAGVVAAQASAWRDGGAPTLDDLFDAARGQSTPVLSGLAQKVTSRFAWDDLVLPPDGLEQLQEINNRVEHQHQVLERWGFEQKLDLGRGTIALFAGNSGTGKTMAAGVMANSLSLDLYRLDLSAVVSKYIGETEKNLSAIFKEAERSNAILFFDEADALFGKRSEVKDAHDRYANIETAYLLQRMEAYGGVVILATNLKMNLDEAFLRRLHFAVDFPMPNEPHRRIIWQKAFPAEAPVTRDVDWDFLARQFKISGGNIKNSVIAAAFFAAAEQSEIGMKHLMRGIRREYQKLGRMVTAAEFGPYADLFAGGENGRQP